MERLDDAGVEMVVYEPTLDVDEFFGAKVDQRPERVQDAKRRDRL